MQPLWIIPEVCSLFRVIWQIISTKYDKIVVSSICKIVAFSNIHTPWCDMPLHSNVSCFNVDNVDKALLHIRSFLELKMRQSSISFNILVPTIAFLPSLVRAMLAKHKVIRSTIWPPSCIHYESTWLAACIPPNFTRTLIEEESTVKHDTIFRHSIITSRSWWNDSGKEKFLIKVPVRVHVIKTFHCNRNDACISVMIVNAMSNKIMATSFSNV